MFMSPFLKFMRHEICRTVQILQFMRLLKRFMSYLVVLTDSYSLPRN